ncbi:MAG: acyl-ACP--UDP-N-acetylglucosamine O-acyltransferase, partial [Opitutae bacterium]|nr:acyl-ACP--UDP-N-acetylglucosamine O-acyltransferase [Opitutae bacterium]
IGQGAMIGGLSEISLDIPPQVLVSGRNLISGLNLIGMKRRKIPQSAVSEIKNCFREVMENGNLKKIAKQILNRKPTPSGDVTLDFLNFFLTGKRGFARLSKKKSPQVDR